MCSMTLKYEVRLDKIVRKAGGIVDKKQDDLGTLFQRRTTNKILEIIKDPMHTLHEGCDSRHIEHSRRYRTLKTRIARHLNSSLPKSITRFNDKYKSK